MLRRFATALVLTELSEQIEHFGRNVLAYRLLIGGAQRLADFGRGAALLAGPRSFVTFNLMRRVALAPPVLVILEAQIPYPLAAGAAPAHLYKAYASAPELLPNNDAQTHPAANNGLQSGWKQKSRPLVPTH